MSASYANGVRRLRLSKKPLRLRLRSTPNSGPMSSGSTSLPLRLGPQLPELFKSHASLHNVSGRSGLSPSDPPTQRRNDGGNGLTEIPKGNYDAPAPCWIPCQRYDSDVFVKPAIKCQCGVICGIGLHHVHADGRVTASFFHSQAAEFSHNGKTYRHAPGCGWHVFLKLKDYNCGEFPPMP